MFGHRVRGERKHPKKQRENCDTPKESPWYHVLVDGSGHATYVAERHLEPDTAGEPVEHPLTAELFGEFHDGHYLPKGGLQ